MIKIFSVLLLILFSIDAIAQADFEDEFYIRWRSDYKLKYSDFKLITNIFDTNWVGEKESPYEIIGNDTIVQELPSFSFEGDAGSGLIIETHYYIDSNYLEYDISARFDCYSSFMPTKNALFLQHEQVHFDLYELYSRKIKQKLHNLPAANANTIYINHIIKHFRDLLSDENYVFDRITSYDRLFPKSQQINTTKQWSNRVKKEIELLRAYGKRKNRVLIK